MDKIEILVLNGSPGSGKTSAANAVSDLLRDDEIPHVVIDFDELGRIYPETNKNIQWENLRSVCKNFSKVPDLNRFIIPIALDSAEDIDTLRKGAPYAKWIICELVADRETLLKRVTEREPNKYWREKLRTLVNKYADRPESTKFGELKINTAVKTLKETAKDIIIKVNWNKS